MINKKYNCGIYRIRNIINNNCYIGQSAVLNRREYNHIYSLRRGTSNHYLLQRAWNKFGEKNFKFEILLYCDRENLTYYEQSCVDNLSCEYNILTVCVDSPFGTTRTDESVQKTIESRNYNTQIKFIKRKNTLIKNGIPKERDLDSLRKKYKINDNLPTNYNNSCLVFENGIPDDVIINITKNEMYKIRMFDEHKVQKFLFVLLVLSKYYCFSGEIDYYIFYKNLSTLFAIAKIHLNKKEKFEILNKCINSGLATRDKFNNLIVTFVDNNSEIEIVVDDFTDIIKFFPHYCEVCGIEIEKTGRNHKMCKKCWKERNREIQRNQMREKRAKN